MKLHDLCAINEIPDRQARGFTVDDAGHKNELFIVRHGKRLYGYRNHCPHTGVNLNWQPDQFLNNSAELIQCATHGAQFRINDGFCTFGPCRGRSLTAVRLRLENNRVKVKL